MRNRSFSGHCSAKRGAVQAYGTQYADNGSVRIRPPIFETKALPLNVNAYLFYSTPNTKLLRWAKELHSAFSLVKFFLQANAFSGSTAENWAFFIIIRSPRFHHARTCLRNRPAPPSSTS